MLKINASAWNKLFNYNYNFGNFAFVVGTLNITILPNVKVIPNDEKFAQT